MRTLIKIGEQFFFAPYWSWTGARQLCESLPANQKRLSVPLTEESQQVAAFFSFLSSHRRGEIYSNSTDSLRKSLSMDIDGGGVFNETEAYDYDEDYHSKDFPEEAAKKTFQMVWLPVFYSVVVIVGLLANVLLLIVLAQNRRWWSILDSFFLQLGIVDILLLVTLPVWGAQANQHCEKCPETLFTIFRAVFNVNFYIGIFLLVCICIIYFLTAIHADWFSHHRAKFAFFSCLLVWFVSLLLTGLDWKLLEPDKEILQGKAICVHKYPESGVDRLLGFRLLHLTVGFLLPVALFIIIASHFLRRQHSSGIQKKRPLIVISILMGIFLVCWIPYNIVLIVDIICYRSQNFLNNSPIKFTESVKTALTVTSAVGSVNAGLRPVLYFFLYGTFRKRILNLFKCDTAARHSSLWELGVNPKAPCDQSAAEQKEML